MTQPMRGADSTSVRRWNEYAVIEALQGSKPKRVSELVQLAGMTPASLGGVLRSLEGKGWVQASDPLPGAMGRPAQLFGLSTPAGGVLGVDIGGRTVRAVALDLAGRQLWRGERGFDPAGGIEPCRQALREVVSESRSAMPGPVWLTAVALAGVVDGQGRVLASTARPEWDGRRLAAELAADLPSRAFTIGETRAFVYAEHRVGVAQDADDFVLLLFSRRPSLGLFLDGRTHPGTHGAAGDLDWNQSVPRPPSLTWLAPFLADQDPLGSAVAAALAGDDAVLAGVATSIVDYVPVLAVAAAMVDPELIVLGGGLTPVMPRIIDQVERAFAANTRFPPRLAVSALDRYGAALGAALMGCSVIFDSLADSTDGVRDLTLESFQEVELPIL